MRVVIIGGKLQGTEAAYLANKAGWETLLIDKKDHRPAQGLSHEFEQFDISNGRRFQEAVKGADMIIPALEDRGALKALNDHSRYLDLPLIFDEKAYHVSNSKVRSNALFKEIGVLQPPAGPECGFPLIAKPSHASGSIGVNKLLNVDDYERFVCEQKNVSVPWVFQKYIDGPSFSIEVIGSKDRFSPLQVTELVMDKGYDCKQVIAPVNLSQQLVGDFEQLAIRLAKTLGLQGIMDVEVILNCGQLYVLEIDARLPSQTPTAVYWSSGCNILKLLRETARNDLLSKRMSTELRAVIYEHVCVSSGTLLSAGEHLLAKAGPLHIEYDFFGADEAITDYVDGKSHWVATLIHAEATLSAVWAKRERAIASICKGCCIDRIVDSKLNPNQ